MEYTPLTLAGQLLKFMDTVGIARAHLSGESLGGWVASFGAIKYPQRVNRLQLNTAGGIPISVKGQADMQTLMELSKKMAGQPPTFENVKARIAWLIHPDNHHLITDELVNLRLHTYTLPAGREVMPLVNRLLPRHDKFLIPLEKIMVPKKLLWTRDNPIHDLGSAIAAQQRSSASPAPAWWSWRPIAATGRNPRRRRNSTASPANFLPLPQGRFNNPAIPSQIR